MTSEYGSAFEEMAQRINELDEAQKVRFIAALAKSKEQRAELYYRGQN